MIIHLGRQAEADLRTHGFDIPMYPESGPVSLNGDEVGFISNFNGLTIRDTREEAVKLLVRLNDTIKMGLWNIPGYAK